MQILYIHILLYAHSSFKINTAKDERYGIPLLLALMENSRSIAVGTSSAVDNCITQ